MVTKVLSVVGAIAVLGALGTAGAGLMLVKDRITVVLQENQPPGAADPTAMLRDEVAALRQQVETLQTALGSNFENLGKALDERAEARHEAALAEWQKARAERDADRRGQAELGRALAQLGGKVDGLAGAIATAAAGKTAAVPEVWTVPPEAHPAESPAELPVQPVAAVETPTEPKVEAAPPTAKRGGFLSFKVPESKFGFTEPQEYQLVKDLCRVGFDAKSTLHDFTGVTTAVSGSFVADLDDPAGAWHGAIRCSAATLNTGVEGRDDNLRDHLSVAEFPDIVFTLESFVPGKVDVEAQTCEGTVKGSMAIRGKTQALAMPVTVKVDESKRLVVDGQVPLKLSDYGVPVPSQLGGAITMEDEVKVWVALRARPRVGGAK
ncbi:MAG: hypothetical protein RL398_590 [Planctomycetota bacterium]|jgi:polyisoprenoid-binding protein YceI